MSGGQEGWYHPAPAGSLWGWDVVILGVLMSMGSFRQEAQTVSPMARGNRVVAVRLRGLLALSLLLLTP